MNSKLSKENNVEYYIDLNTFLSLTQIYEFEFFFTYYISAWCKWGKTQQSPGLVESVDGVTWIKPEQTWIAWTSYVIENLRQTVMNLFFNVEWVPEETFSLLSFWFYSVCHFINPKAPFSCKWVIYNYIECISYSDNFTIVNIYVCTIWAWFYFAGVVFRVSDP